ncbi:hypothetical protein ABIG06_006234 [Bradyrhizobium sp. USDA 326]|uniref:hypothetical protein n=1 Tax=unclassified Bradyrhizobium TaxID=2631580 RepID=UPI00351745AD
MADFSSVFWIVLWVVVSLVIIGAGLDLVGWLFSFGTDPQERVRREAKARDEAEARRLQQALRAADAAYRSPAGYNHGIKMDER